VHVYLDVSGDIIAYYRNTEDISKMIDWRHYTAGQPVGSKLEWALNKVCQAMSVSLPEVKTYDFRYPQAQQIKIIVDESLHTGEETFRVRIPNNFTLYRIGWSQYLVDGAGYGAIRSTLYVDENVAANQLHTGSSESWAIFIGEIPPSLIAADDIYHTLGFTHTNSNGSVYTAIVLVYTENQ
jgi:hypothetical protein